METVRLGQPICKSEEDIENVKNILWEIYKKFKDCYREYSA